ncbi:hypothetical protein D3C71_1189510 [compost metagenome]
MNVKIHKIEVSAEIIVNAVMTFGTINKIEVPTVTQAIENTSPLIGTLLLDNLLKLLGASLSNAKPYNIRLVAKIPLLAEDRAEVATTKLIKPAAIGNPTNVNISTNGLFSGETFAQDVTAIIQTNAPT